tara:strand:- start:95 stop:334 length:240 start_codon:yes stop_codon:yes gene_type:complete
MQLKKSISKVLQMTSSEDAKEFVRRAEENGLQISVEHASEVGGFGAVVEAAYATIRKIEDTGFEPTAIFVPTASKREDA